MTRRRGVEAAEDPALLTVTGSFAPVVTLVGKTWGLHLEKVTKVSREENLAMIAESVAFCRERGKRVVYDAEHFFDSYREDPGYALSCLEAAIDAGAENVTLCDTNGASLPNQVGAATEVVATRFGDRAEIGIHAHDDAGCGVANSLAAVERRGAHGAGHRERLRRALRQRQPDLDPARAAAEDGLRRRPPRASSRR